MYRSAIAQGSQKINRRTKLAVELTEVNNQIGALSNIVSIQDIKITALSNLMTITYPKL